MVDFIIMHVILDKIKDLNKKNGENKLFYFLLCSIFFHVIIIVVFNFKTVLDTSSLASSTVKNVLRVTLKGGVGSRHSGSLSRANTNTSTNGVIVRSSNPSNMVIPIYAPPTTPNKKSGVVYNSHEIPQTIPSGDKNTSVANAGTTTTPEKMESAVAEKSDITNITKSDGQMTDLTTKSTPKIIASKKSETVVMVPEVSVTSADNKNVIDSEIKSGDTTKISGDSINETINKSLYQAQITDNYNPFANMPTPKKSAPQMNIEYEAVDMTNISPFAKMTPIKTKPDIVPPPQPPTPLPEYKQEKISDVSPFASENLNVPRRIIKSPTPVYKKEELSDISPFANTPSPKESSTVNFKNLEQPRPVPVEPVKVDYDAEKMNPFINMPVPVKKPQVQSPPQVYKTEQLADVSPFETLRTQSPAPKPDVAVADPPKPVIAPPESPVVAQKPEPVAAPKTTPSTIPNIVEESAPIPAIAKTIETPKPVVPVASPEIFSPTIAPTATPSASTTSIDVPQQTSPARSAADIPQSQQPSSVPATAPPTTSTQAMVQTESANNSPAMSSTPVNTPNSIGVSKSAELVNKQGRGGDTATLKELGMSGNSVGHGVGQSGGVDEAINKALDSDPAKKAYSNVLKDAGEYVQNKIDMINKQVYNPDSKVKDVDVEWYIKSWGQKVDRISAVNMQPTGNSGEVDVRFIMNKDGTISDIQILDGSTNNQVLIALAKRVIMLTTPFMPFSVSKGLSAKYDRIIMRHKFIYISSKDEEYDGSLLNLKF